MTSTLETEAACISETSATLPISTQCKDRGIKSTSIINNSENLKIGTITVNEELESMRK
jgi:hypothetical protein